MCEADPCSRILSDQLTALRYFWASCPAEGRAAFFASTPMQAIEVDHRQSRPNCRRHWEEDTGLVKVLLVSWPIAAFLVALLGPRTLLQGKARDKHDGT